MVVTKIAFAESPEALVMTAQNDQIGRIPMIIGNKIKAQEKNVSQHGIFLCNLTDVSAREYTHNYEILLGEVGLASAYES